MRKLAWLDQQSIFGIERRVWLLKGVLSSGCFIGLILSRRLWLSARHYPLSPISEKLPVVPPPLDYILFITLLILLIFIAVVSRPLKYLVASLFLALLLGLSDQSRWQPWFYQYVLMLAAVCFYSRRTPDVTRQQALLNSCRLMVASIYFWSGVQKLNDNFINGIFPSIIYPYLKFIFGTVDIIPSWLFITIPMLEIFIGIGLFTRKFRNVSVLSAVLMHVGILLLFIPLGRNSVVWPWNAAMAGFAVILFWQSDDFSMREALFRNKPGFQTIVLILFGVMPLFSLFNLWDSYLSSSLYSGNIASAFISIGGSTQRRLPPGIQTYAYRGDPGGKAMIDPNRWSFSELNVPAYPENRIFINITKQICVFAENPTDVNLVIYGKLNWLYGNRETYNYDCSNLR